MKIFIAGATGVLGHRLVDRLSDHGHEIHGLVRDDDGAECVDSNGGTPRRGDVLQPETLSTAVDEDVEVIVHAATHFPVKMKPTEDDWTQNDRVRKEGAKNLLAAAGSDVKQFVFPSVVMVARQPDGSQFDETADRYPDRATQSAAAVEKYLQTQAALSDVETTILRTGFYYAPDAGHTRFWGKQLLDGDLPIVGGGLLGRTDAEMSLLHVDDAASAVTAAIEARATGLYHVVDEEPVTGAALFSYFADLLEAPTPSRIPGWLARFFVGKVNAKGFTSPFPTTNQKFKQEVGWEPAYPTFRDGLKQVVETWLEKDDLIVTEDGLQWAENVPVHYSCRSCGRHFHMNMRACPHCESHNRQPMTY